MCFTRTVEGAYNPAAVDIILGSASDRIVFPGLPRAASVRRGSQTSSKHTSGRSLLWVPRSQRIYTVVPFEYHVVMMSIKQIDVRLICSGYLLAIIYSYHYTSGYLDYTGQSTAVPVYPLSRVHGSWWLT
jgi:hypothetical protein